jgi:hypothetical protein
MPNVEYNRRFRIALVIDEAFLHRVYECLKEFLPGTDCQIAVETDGHLTITSNDLGDVLASEIIQTDSIKKIRLSGRAYDKGVTKNFSFEAEKNETFKTCNATIEGPDANNVMAFRARVENLIRAASLWYSIFRPNNYAVSIAASGLLCTTIFAVAMIGLKTFNVFDNWLTVGIFFAGNLFLAVIVMTKVARKLFPSVVFYIGYSRRAADTIARVRNILFVVVGLGLLVAVSAIYLFELMRGH